MGILEIIIQKGRKSGKENEPSNVMVGNIVPINSMETNDFAEISVEKVVLRFLKNIELRNSQKAKENIKAMNIKKKLDNRLMRIPEAELQNSLLRIIYQHNLTFGQISRWIKIALVKYKKEDSVDLQREVESVLRGVESCSEAVSSLKKELELKHKNENILIGTNNELDALNSVDLVVMIEKKDGTMEILNLIQVKSSLDKESAENIINEHQKYLDALPQLVGMLNKQEAAMLVEEKMNLDIVDIDRKENLEQLTLFGLVFDQYINNAEDFKNINAKDFYEFFKKEGGVLSPFTVMGILKNPKVINEYRKNNYLKGNKEIEKYLTKTADEIPFTEEESRAFHEKNHIHTITKSTKIISIVMIRGNKISEKELKLPYLNKEK
ncbi:MAG: hypothetical protein ABH951_02600 [Patescibacteria group bacterium]